MAPDISPLVYDSAAASAVWQRVSPALPAFGPPSCPAGARCPLPRRLPDSEAALVSLVADAASLYAACRRCAAHAPRAARAPLARLSLSQQRALRSLLAAYFLHTGRWCQPPAPPPAVQESFLPALRRVYIAESLLQRGCAALSLQLEDGCLRQLLAAQADLAAQRAKTLALLLENALTTANSLLKW